MSGKLDENIQCFPAFGKSTYFRFLSRVMIPGEVF